MLLCILRVKYKHARQINAKQETETQVSIMQFFLPVTFDF